MAFGNFSFGGSYFAEGANPVTPTNVACHGYISDFSPCGSGGMISDRPTDTPYNYYADPDADDLFYLEAPI